MKNILNPIYAIFLKELKLEFKTKISVNTVLLFVLVSISLIVFSTSGIVIKEALQAAILWIVVFFTAMTSLSRVFIYEEERGTIDFLKLNAKSTNIYLGKLLFNISLSLFTSIVIALFMFVFFNQFVIRTFSIFAVSLFLGSLSISSSTTILSAIITKASSKSSLLPILAFPILLPIILIAIDSTRLALEGWELSEAMSNFYMLFSYIGISTTVSVLLFDFIWQE